MTSAIDDHSPMSDILNEMKNHNGRISLEDNKKYLMESPLVIIKSPIGL